MRSILPTVIALAFLVILTNFPAAQGPVPRGALKHGPVWERIDQRRRSIEATKAQAFPGRVPAEAEEAREEAGPPPSTITAFDRFRRSLGRSNLDEIRSRWHVEDEELLEAIKQGLERKKEDETKRSDLQRYRGQFSAQERSRHRQRALEDTEERVRRALQFRRIEARRAVRSLNRNPLQGNPRERVMSRRLRKALKEARSSDPGARRRALNEVRKMTLSDRRALKKQIRRENVQGARRVGRSVTRDRRLLRQGFR